MTTPDQLPHTRTRNKSHCTREGPAKERRPWVPSGAAVPASSLSTPERRMGDTGPFAAPAPRGARKRGRGVGRGAGLHTTGEPVFDDKHPSWQVCIGVVACLRGPQDLLCVDLCHNEGALP
jgi:hypothetical protein